MRILCGDSGGIRRNINRFSERIGSFLGSLGDAFVRDGDGGVISEREGKCVITIDILARD